MENADDDKQTEEEVITEEFHDAATVIAGSGPSLSGNEKTEIHILIEITYRGKSEAEKSPSKHLQILNALGEAFTKAELDMFDIKGKKVKRSSVQQWREITTYEEHFTLHEFNNRHYVVFRALTTKTFGELKRAPAVWDILNRTGSYMKKHHWSVDEWDIITLGFLIEIDPSRHLSADVREYVIALSKRGGCLQENGCNFKLVPERFKTRNKNAHFTTYAYAVQCPRKDAKSVDAMMKNTFRNEGQMYVKLKLRKTAPASYSNAMTLQNRYLSHVRTITVVGITRSTMKYLKQSLLQNEEVNYVAATNKTDSIGRWDIITMEYCQETLQGWIEEKLDKLLEECPQESFHDRPEEFPEPGIQSRNARMSDEDSSQGGVSYLSSSAGSYDSVVQEFDQEEYREEPGNGIIKGKTWAQAVARNPQTPTSTTSSHPTQSNISELTTPTVAQQNRRYDEMEKRLQDEIMGMRTDMQRMLERMEARDKRAEEEAETAKKTRDQEFNGNQFQYPPLGINGYNTNYHPHASSPGYNFQQMYQGYPSGYASQPYEASPMRDQMNGQSLTQQRPDFQQRVREVIPHPEARDLNKRSLESPSFPGEKIERTKRTDQRETPSRDDPMVPDQSPDPAGQHRMTQNPYHRNPGTPTTVSPPNHIRRGMYPLEWKTVRHHPGYGQHHSQLLPPEGYNRQDPQPHHHDGHEQTTSHPAADARHFGV